MWDEIAKGASLSRCYGWRGWRNGKPHMVRMKMELMFERRCPRLKCELQRGMVRLRVREMRDYKHRTDLYHISRGTLHVIGGSKYQ